MDPSYGLRDPSAANATVNATADVLGEGGDSVFECIFVRTNDDTVWHDIRGTSWDGLIASVRMYGMVGLALLTINELTRTWWPRKVAQGRLPPLGRLPVLGWLVPILKVDDVQLLRNVGLDSFVLLRYIRLCLRICSFCGVWGVLVLMPIYREGGWEVGVSETKEWWNTISMENLSPGSPLITITAVFAWVLTTYTCYLFNQEWKSYVQWRVGYLRDGDPDTESGIQAAYTLRVEAIPVHLRSDAALYEHFDSMFPGQVHSVTVQIDLSKLEAIINQRQQTCEMLEAAVARKAVTHRPPYHTIITAPEWCGSHCCWKRSAAATAAAAAVSEEEGLDADWIAGGPPTSGGGSASGAQDGEASKGGQRRTGRHDSSDGHARTGAAARIDSSSSLLLGSEPEDREVAQRYFRSSSYDKTLSSMSSDGSTATDSGEVAATGAAGANAAAEDVESGGDSSGGEADDWFDQGEGYLNEIDERSSLREREAIHPSPSRRVLKERGSRLGRRRALHRYYQQLMSYRAAVWQRGTGHARSESWSCLGGMVRRVPTIPYLEQKLHIENILVSGALDDLAAADQELEADQASKYRIRLRRLLRLDGLGDVHDGGPLGRESMRDSVVSSTDRALGAVHRRGSRRTSHRDTLSDLEVDIDIDSDDEGVEAGGPVFAAAAGVVEAGGVMVAGFGNTALRDIHTLADATILGLTAVARGLKVLVLGEGKSASAYVTMKTKTAVCDAKQVLLSNRVLALQVSQASNPGDLLWPNTAVTWRQRAYRTVLMQIGLCIFGVAGWVPVITIINGMANLDELSKLLPALQTYSHEELWAIVQSQLPAGLQLMLLSALPYLFHFLIVKYERVKTRAEVQQSIMSRYFAFTLVHVYFTIGAGSLFSALKIIADHPGCVFVILGASLPQVALYFIQMVVIKMLVGLPLELCRCFPLCRMMIAEYWTDKAYLTQRQLRHNELDGRSRRDHIYEDGGSDLTECLYGWIFPQLLLVIIIAMTYAPINPLVLPVCAVYFATAYCVYKYLAMYFYVPKFQTGGALFPVLFQHTLTGLSTAQCTLIGYMAIKQAWSQFFCVLPLPFTLVAFRWWIAAAYDQSSRVLSRETAVAVDEEDRKKGVHPSESFDPHLYQQPALSKRWLDPEPYRPASATSNMSRETEAGRGAGAGGDNGRGGNVGGEGDGGGSESERMSIELNGLGYGSVVETTATQIQ